MDGFLKNVPISSQKDILHHVEYAVAQSRFSFDDFETYQALAHSVRDRLLERWHGRINLGIWDPFADALSQLGFEFEVLAEQLIHYDILRKEMLPGVMEALLVFQHVKWIL
ncbi:glycogen phosphorylase 1-like isoform X3 [Durio zibethinus]|uniref:Glycogen phosphorylase 1-like isoform X3 n=1 Tax=Durio zibethinus TaxID=66656 RepID=A0A6P5WY36_DURZI|nr:glycogen phosphorylase 1-like isoform X3 [Durio zibethinus]